MSEVRDDRTKSGMADCFWCCICRKFTNHELMTGECLECHKVVEYAREG